MTTKPKAKRFRIRRSPAAGAAARAAGSLRVASPEAGAQPGARPGVNSGANSGANAGAAPTGAAAAGTAPPRSTAPRRPATSGGAAASAARAPDPAESDQKDDETLRAGEVSSAAETAAETDIDAIRREGLTGRQLRMARRVAQKYNLPATSDFDAVRLLRLNGIDPFKRSNILELVVPQGGADQHEGGLPDAFANLPARQDTGDGRVQLPQTVPVKRQTLPSTEMSPMERRAVEVSEVQRDLMLRRRRKMMLLLARLAFFVMLPTFIAGWYFYAAATPMYATKSEFLILQADNSGGSGIGGLLSGTQFATNQDSIAVQSYLQSKDAMLRLDQDVGFKSHFVQPWIDPIQRLNPDPTNEEAYRIYKRNVKIGFDPTEGVIRMEVVAADPQSATMFSDRLIAYAEERVNQLSQQKRGDQMDDAMASFENAQVERRKAQEALVQLQQRGALLDPEGVIGTLRSQISTYEVELQEKMLQLAALEQNAEPNQARVSGVKADISRLEAVIDALNGRMTDANQGENSLASLTVQIQMAQADLATRDLLLQSALQQVEQTRMEANRQVRYLTTSVEPVPSEEPSYPRAFENTILAFLIFGGIYLMISLTASILREQVSA